MRRGEVEVFPELVIRKIRQPLYWLNDEEFKFYLNKSFLEKYRGMNLVLELELNGKKVYTRMEKIDEILKSKDIMYKAFLYPGKPMVLVGYIFKIFKHGSELREQNKNGELFREEGDNREA